MATAPRDAVLRHSPGETCLESTLRPGCLLLSRGEAFIEFNQWETDMGLDESVWGLPRETLFARIPEFQGFWCRSFDFGELEAILAQSSEYRPRSECEGDPSFKQFIPYIATQVGDHWLVCERLKRGRESRLHNRLALGLGGHIVKGEASTGRLRAGTERELREELHLSEEELDLTLIGCLNDDSDPVGEVHFGIVGILTLPERVTVRETHKLEGSWKRLEEIKPERDRLESWSQLLLDTLLERNLTLG